MLLSKVALSPLQLDSNTQMAGSDLHIKPLRLFDLARKARRLTTEEESEHLRQCEECEGIIAVFARQFPKVERKPNDKPEDAV